MITGGVLRVKWTLHEIKNAYHSIGGKKTDLLSLTLAK